MSQAILTPIVSMVALLLLSGALAYITYRFPKKKIHPLLLLLLFSLLPILSIFRTGVYQSGDLTLHTTWLMNFFRSLSEGNIFPQWAADRVGGLGYPVFIFQYQIPYYLGSFFHVLGFSFITSAKMVYASAYLLSAITMYLWTKTEFGTKPAVVATFLYQFAPYYLVQMHFVNSFGETLAFAVLPLAFFGIKKYLSTLRYRWFVVAAISFALTILTHQTVGLTSSVFLAGYVVILCRQNKRSIKHTIAGLSALLSGVLLATYYWLPVLQLNKYIQQASNHSVYFAPLQAFFFTPWKFGLLFQGSFGEVGWILGYPQWIVVALFIFLLLKKKIAAPDRPLAWFFFLSFCLVFLMMQSFTQPLWSLPLINNFRLSTRLLLIAAFFVSALTAITVRNTSFSRFWVAICVLAVGTTILNWGSRAMLPAIDDQYLLENEFVNYVDPSLLPIWFQSTWQEQSRITQVYPEHVEILSGEGSVQELSRTTTKHRYQVSAQTPLAIRENTLYFPGWKVMVNGQPVDIAYQEADLPGAIHFSLPTGESTIEVRFANTSSRQLGLGVSAATATLLTAAGLFLWVRKRKVL